MHIKAVISSLIPSLNTFVASYSAVMELLKAVTDPWPKPIDTKMPEGWADRYDEHLAALDQNRADVATFLVSAGRETPAEARRIVAELVAGCARAKQRPCPLEADRVSELALPILQALSLARSLAAAELEGQVGTPTAPAITGETLPADGTKYTSEKDVPAAFREGGKPDGAVLTTTYLADKENGWDLLGSYLSRNHGPRKTLTTRIQVGKPYAYLFKELTALRHIKTGNKASREREPSASERAEIDRRKVDEREKIYHRPLA